MRYLLEVCGTDVLRRLFLFLGPPLTSLLPLPLLPLLPLLLLLELLFLFEEDEGETNLPSSSNSFAISCAIALMSSLSLELQSSTSLKSELGWSVTHFCREGSWETPHRMSPRVLRRT